MAKKVYIGVKEKLEVLDYIESTGTQYIDTGIIPTNIFSIETEISRTDLSTTDGICGSRSSTPVWGMYLYLTNSSNDGKYACAYGSQNIYISQTSYADYLKHKIKLELNSTDGLKSYIDDTLVSTNTYSEISNGLNFYLFKCNDGGNTRISKVKMYSFKIWNNGTLVRDFIPVKIESGECCLYDKVTQTKFYNQGTGVFTAGETTGEVITLEDKAGQVKKIYVGKHEELEVLDYIESTGSSTSGQYINTGFIANQDTTVEIDFTVLSTDTSGIFTDMNAKLNNAFNLLIIDGKFRIDYNTTSSLLDSPVPTLGTKYKFKLEKGIGYINDVQVFSADYAEFNCPWEMILLAATYGNASGDFFSNLSAYANVYLHSCKIYNNEALVRDYIPIKDEKGIYCLYDNISKTCFYNNGTGDFIAGEPTGEKINLGNKAKKVIKGYIGINGIAKQFFGIRDNKYYGTISSLSIARSELASANADKYILFAGGANGSEAYANVDAYDGQLTKTTATNLKAARKQLAGTYVENYAIFAGGCVTDWSNQMATADSYNDSLVKHTISDLNAYTLNGAAVNLDNYAFFTGGNEVDSTAYNTSLVKSRPPSLPSKQEGLAGVRIGNYGVFAGGRTGRNATSQVPYVVAYNTSLTRSTITDLSEARVLLGGATTGNYALFAGGATSNWGNDGPVDIVDVYDTSLVRHTPLSLSVPKFKMASISIGGFAVFAGGTTNGLNGASSLKNIDIFDKNLVRTAIQDLSQARSQLSAGEINNYVLFAGGYPTTNIVDVYDFYEEE